MRLRSATWLRDEVAAFPDWVVGIDGSRSVGKSRNQATQQPWWMRLLDGHGLVDRLTKADDPETVDLSLCRGGLQVYARVCGWCKCGLQVMGETVPKLARASFPTNRSWENAG